MGYIASSSTDAWPGAAQGAVQAQTPRSSASIASLQAAIKTWVRRKQRGGERESAVWVSEDESSIGGPRAPEMSPWRHRRLTRRSCGLHRHSFACARYHAACGAARGSWRRLVPQAARCAHARGGLGRGLAWTRQWLGPRVARCLAWMSGRSSPGRKKAQTLRRRRCAGVGGGDAKRPAGVLRRRGAARAAQACALFLRHRVLARRSAAFQQRLWAVMRCFAQQ
jgi:hypothetical protein